MKSNSLGKRDPTTKDNSQSSRGNWENVPCLIPTWTQKSSYSVHFPTFLREMEIVICTRATKGQVATTAEENLERLKDAGFLVEDLIPVCFNCSVKGHGKIDCPNPPEGCPF